MIKSSTHLYSASMVLVFLILSQSGTCGNSKMKANSNDSNQKSNTSPQTQSQHLTGSWGGQGISMEIVDSGATLNFDCAHGTISEAIGIDSNGKFEVKGLFTKERGGPIREGESNEGSPAIYSGVVDGENLTLTITLPGNQEKVGTFTLGHGKTPRIRRCM
jgi:hypothetical protein